MADGLGARIIEGLKQAQEGKLGRVTIEGQTWEVVDDWSRAVTKASVYLECAAKLEERSGIWRRGRARSQVTTALKIEADYLRELARRLVFRE